jgi:cyclic pyranopterin phosphate synthase
LAAEPEPKSEFEPESEQLMTNDFSHISDDNQPTMVDVGDKTVTHRSATAESRVVLTDAVLALLSDGDIKSKKGPVFQTAIIAGTMAAKRTHDLIPFCHPLPLENCKLVVEVNDAGEAVVTCTVSVHHKTGVEMEALTAASVAALTIYDMCKAVTKDMVIRETRLLEKRGGKSDYDAT